MRYINIIGGLTLWLVCILILVDHNGWIAKQDPEITILIWTSAAFMWYVGSRLLAKELGIDGDGNE